MQTRLLRFMFTILTVASRGQTRIQDNSFLIEEAYNQEAGIVQHIHASQFSDDFKSADCSFTQEWPLGSMAHQLSFTLPYRYENRLMLSDILLNYRYQLISNNSLALAPEFSALLPTGNSRLDGAGMTGFLVNIPVSFQLNSSFAFHGNLGNAASWSCKRKDDIHQKKSEAINYGASVVYFMARNFNLLVESVHSSSFTEYSSGLLEKSASTILNPGIRFALNFSSGMQIVPGFSIPYNLKSHENFYFFNLSVEHAFKKIKS
jgi:hypothetical protein